MEQDERNNNVKAEPTVTHTYAILLDGDWCSGKGLKDEEALCLDATFFGNAARFIKHMFPENVASRHKASSSFKPFSEHHVSPPGEDVSPPGEDGSAVGKDVSPLGKELSSVDLGFTFLPSPRSSSLVGEPAEALAYHGVPWESFLICEEGLPVTFGAAAGDVLCMTNTRRLRSGREYPRNLDPFFPVDTELAAARQLRRTQRAESREASLLGVARLFRPPLPVPPPVIPMANKPSIIQPGQVAFHGVEDFNAFINMFDTICFARNITDDADKAKQLGQMFMGTAAAWYSRLEPAVKNSFAAVVAAGRTEYVPTTLQDQIRDKLDRLQKLPYETMQTYIQRFQYLTSLMTPALTEEVLLSAFKRGLPDHIHNWLTLQKVNSLAGALTEARTYAQCEERSAQIPDPTYYIPGLKGQVMINPYMSPTMGSPSAVPFIPGASLVPTPPQPPTSWFQHVPGVDVHHAPAIPFIPTAGAYPAIAQTSPQVIPQALPATPTAQPTAAATGQVNNTTTAQSPTFATTDQVAQLMVKLE
ncbi:hypothetical protein R1sor_003226 [Riccia sorocarpa]|uniref:Retrotransposon gag domain-containing protein n=1 Tax=Riccia sorocarpa TaxID=122646 RepID=A0ABD3H746_9MARC